jgi:hypothetical protein
VLFVTAGGNGHCLELYIFARGRTSQLLPIWSREGMPGGAGFCRASPKNPLAYVTGNKNIVVKIPWFDYERDIEKPPEYFRYIWNGRTYVDAVNGRISKGPQTLRWKNACKS